MFTVRSRTALLSLSSIGLVKTVLRSYRSKFNCRFFTPPQNIHSHIHSLNPRIHHWTRKSSTSAFASYGSSTIYAVATGGLRSAVGIVRVSGPSSSKVLQEIGRFPPDRFPVPRVATVKSLYDVNNDTLLDHAMVLWFPGPNSYTGEDCCEFHVHGGLAVIDGLLRSISSFEDCRMAEPGEFTRRSFLNGKMDLTRVDGLADLISAETEMQRVQALNQMSGSLATLYESWRDRIAKCLANVEAFIDFGEDENIEPDILKTVEDEVLLLLQEMKVHLEDSKRGQRLRDGVLVAILGKPNVGKSSLLNLLCKREAAIVSDIPGTTRDVLQATINLDGYPVLLADTAGIRDSPGDVIETEGIRRALNEAKKADLLVLLVDANDPRFFGSDVEGSGKSMDRNQIIQDEILQQLYKEDDVDLEAGDIPLNLENIIIVGNKMDLDLMDGYHQARKDEENPQDFDAEAKGCSILDCRISCKTLDGYENFLNLLGSKVSDLCANPKCEAAYITHERYRSHIANCVSHLSEYLKFSEHCSQCLKEESLMKSGSQSYRGNGSLGNYGEPTETLSVDFALGTVPLKNAMNSIGSITGHYGTEDILDIIFRDFCIGK